MITDEERRLVQVIMCWHRYHVAVIKQNAEREAEIEDRVSRAEIEIYEYQEWLDGIVRLCLTGN